MIFRWRTICFSVCRKYLLPMVAGICISVSCIAQTITLTNRKLSIRELIDEILVQTRYSVVYSLGPLEEIPSIKINCRNASLQDVLDSCFMGLQINYSIFHRSIVIFRKVSPDASLYIPLEGRVQATNGEPLAGASIAVDGMPQQISSADGSFRCPVKALRSIVTISYSGYSPRTVVLSNTKLQMISLEPCPSLLEDVIVPAYKSSGQWYAASSIIRNTEWNGALTGIGVPEVMEGRLTGLSIHQYNGVPGSAFGVLIRGRNSIQQSTDPLIVVDGVPIQLAAGLSTIGSGSAQGPMGASVFNVIPVSSISSIEVLKGAAATVKYGNRGVNGALLLTLIKGRAGQTRWEAEVCSGINATVKTSPLLNTVQYLELRKEAIRNDGLPVNAVTLPELYQWDSTRYTDFKKMMTGNMRTQGNNRIALSGGDTNTVYRVSGNYQRETAVFPAKTGDDRLSLDGSLRHQSPDRRLQTDLSVLYNWENNLLPIQDYTSFMYLAPNAPPFEDNSGHPAWISNGIPFINIPAFEKNSYRADVKSQLSHFQLSYKLLPGLTLRSNLGFYGLLSTEHSQLLIPNQAPAIDPRGLTYYNRKTGYNNLIEGLAEYTRPIGPGRLVILLGRRWQNQETAYSSIYKLGFVSDTQLATGEGNPISIMDQNRVVNHYETSFANMNYSFLDRYCVFFSARQDRSNRFGPGNQVGNFWAIGASWTFSKERFFKKWRWLSFGKLKGSLGTAGNDQISNSTDRAYATGSIPRTNQGLHGIYPVSIFNSNLRWEINYNSELAVDLGFLHDNILLSAAAYRDWTINQLVYTSFSSPPGMPGMICNLPANVVNEGLEFSLHTRNFTSAHFEWASTFSLTVPVNRLARFPSLSSSVYANSLVVGKSLSVVKGFQYEGVNPASGLFQFRDVNKDGIIDARDRLVGGNLDLRYYGGCDQRFRYKNFQVDIFFEFRLQNGVNPFVVLYQQIPPGFAGPLMLGNAPSEWLHRWQHPGDHAPLQRVTESTSSPAYGAIANYINSDASVINASFIRWKSLEVSYRIPEKQLAPGAIREARIYLRGQNLLTYSHFPVTDPETQDPTVLPPVRSVMIGMQLSF